MIATIALAVLFLAGPTTAPATRPVDNGGLGMSPDEARARMDEMNRRAAQGSAAADPADADRVRMSREQFLRTQQARAEAAKQRYFAALPLFQKSQAALPGLEKDIAQIRQDGTAAEQKLNAILRQYEALRSMAEDSGESSFESTTHIRTGISGGAEARTTGTIYDPSARLQAIMAVESRYGPELKQAREQVAALYAEYTSSLGQWQAARLDYYRSSTACFAAQREYTEAMRSAGIVGAKLGNTAQAATAQPTTEPASDEAAWADAERRYPGVDVRAIWKGSVDAAAKIVGKTDPSLNAVATGIFHERCAAAMRAQPATRPADVPADLVPSSK